MHGGHELEEVDRSNKKCINSANAITEASLIRNEHVNLYSLQIKMELTIKVAAKEEGDLVAGPQGLVLLI